MKSKYDVVIIGAGIVGCALAYLLSKNNQFRKILLLEKEGSVACHQSSHNSGVIHSGIYYLPGSLKAINCISGYKSLINFCDKYHVPYNLCGKIIVATSESEVVALHQLHQRGISNGLGGLEFLDPSQIKEKEPYVVGQKGLFVPQTGIIDFATVAKKYYELFIDNGGEASFNEKVVSIQSYSGYNVVICSDSSYEATTVISCAGLHSDRVAKMTDKSLDIQIIPFRGEYYKLAPGKKHLIRNLVYPVPDPNFPFLGVHFTRMINGEVEAGPNAVLAYSREGYSKSDVNLYDLYETLTWRGFHTIAAKFWRTGLFELYRSYSKRAFTKSLQQLVPTITEVDLVPGGCGVRAQACTRRGELSSDFIIRKSDKVIHVCNAPSPAATSSLSIAGTILDMLTKR